MDAIIYNYHIPFKYAIIPFLNNQSYSQDYILLNLYIPTSIYTLK